MLTALEITRPEDESAEMPAFEEAGNLKLCDLIGADYDDARWETLLSQMSKKDTYNLIRHAGYGTMAVESIGAPGTVHKDGPAGISSTLAGGNLHCMAYELRWCWLRPTMWSWRPAAASWWARTASPAGCRSGMPRL